jgi:dihydropteroate synthase
VSDVTAGSPSGAAGLPSRPDRCIVMGVLNVTPDSFSDGGLYFNSDGPSSAGSSSDGSSSDGSSSDRLDVGAAVAQGVALAADGADLVDVGGESTRPGAERVDADTECARVLPVVRGLVAQRVAVSVDTTRAAVAAAALGTGATVVNDVSGGLGDPDMARVVADAGCPWVLMHWRGHSRDMQQLARYGDVVAEVRDELSARVDAALAGGVRPAQLVLDPGLGFAKTAEHNWALLASLDVLRALGFPVLVGASRKSFLGRLLAGPDGTPRPVDDREAATVATTLLAADAGAWGVRVHDVRASVDALSVRAATRTAQRRATRAATRAVPASPADRIVLTGLRVSGRHGVYSSERRDGQDFVVDAVLHVDTRPAAASDDVADTVHYGELAERLARIVAGEPVNLLETLAARLADACLADPRVGRAEVTVHKPHAPIPLDFSDVAVTVRRDRPEGAPR